MHTRPPCPAASYSPDPVWSPFIHHHMVIFHDSNIANHALVTTYISPVIGNHPTSTGLSIAKHIFDPRPT